ncbi:MAG: sodium/proline symporter PutP [Clostridiales bacterium]|jgi:sodium/proline symporter|nr:sodium/proline symporter PutP [Clostridiales bacterium]
MNWQLVAFVLYFAVIVGIGVYFYLKTRGGNEKDYFIGGRKMNSWVTALSAQASDMSAWLLMGLPGSIFAAGLGKVWISIGLLIGTYLNWKFVAPRLRRFSQESGDAITIPEYLTNRFLAQSTALQVISALVFLVCFTVYTASSLKACGVLFNIVFGWDVTVTTWAAAGIILFYTFLGGFAAVCWTDFIQGILMLCALLIVPVLALFSLQNTPSAVASAALPEHYFNFLPSGKFDWTSISTILSGLGWGLGYFGMPHILVRFMSIKHASMIKKSRVIAMVWVVLALAAATAVGIIGRMYVPELADGNTEQVFIQMVGRLLPSFIGGLFLSGILAASMSTADSQLLVSASAFASDIYKPIFTKNKVSDRQMMMVSRLVVLIISVIAAFIAINPNSGNIMSLVENAWAGFGSSFGPVIILSLFWRRFNYTGAIAGIIAGAVTDIVWLLFLSAPTGLYEIFPGFAASLIAAIVVANMTARPSKEIEQLFDKAVTAVSQN